ncbi:sugar ABC transporter substrate-binding protein [Haladaptatus sp. CMAA 1911]|uniref:sugar ABC transporter substrate-binding protein n=1 Tax=unclassified Haladaptatus TaxID=2622732 RepID=UPI0037547370
MASGNKGSQWHRDTSDRRRYLKTLGAIGLGGSTVLAGCTGDSGGESEEYEKAFSTVPTLENDYWNAFKRGYSKATDAYGVSTNIQANGGSTTDMLSQVDSAVTQGAQSIIGTASKDSGVPSLAKKAKDADIPFIEMWAMGKWYTPPDAGEQFVQYNIPEPVKTGKLIAKVLFEEMGGSGNFVHITGMLGTVGANGRNMGVEEAMKEYPDVNRLGKPLPGDWVRGKSRQAMQSFVSKFGDKIDGVYAQNDTEALGALTVCRENDLDVPIVGYDGAKEAAKEIKAGRGKDEARIVGSLTAHPPWQAGWAVAKTYDWIHGWRPKIPERMMFTGGTIIVKKPGEWKDKIDYTLTTPETYLDNVFGDGAMPYDWEKMSVKKAGKDSWDPQNKLVPIRKSDFYQLLWKEKNKPNSYSLPKEYGKSKQFDEVEQTYADRYKSNPYE